MDRLGQGHTVHVRQLGRPRAGNSDGGCRRDQGHRHGRAHHGTGATGPTGNSYGDKPGHCCYAIAGPTSHAFTLETGSPDRAGNMRLFAKAVMTQLLKDLG